MTRPAALAAAAIALVGLAGLAACKPAIEAPADKGVCWHMVRGKKGEVPTYHKVADNVPNLESCALDLEAMRTRFLRMGGSHLTIDGAYQGNFIFIERAGVFSSSTLDGAAYIALPRARDGGLIVQGKPVQAPTS
jgi:hypothetical protein